MVKPRRVAWWGKLPARGDFIGRGLPPRWRAEWDAWLQQGLASAALAMDGEALRDRLRGFAPWRYVALPAPREIWCGVLVASHDRVGRAFPLTLAERLPAPMPVRESAQRLMSLMAHAMEGPEALEAAIAAMAPREAAASTLVAPWPEAPCSLWWPVAAHEDAAPLAAAWPPAPSLLLELIDGQPRRCRPAHEAP